MTPLAREPNQEVNVGLDTGRAGRSSSVPAKAKVWMSPLIFQSL